MSRLSGAAALRLGFEQALSLWPAVLAGGLARAGVWLAWACLLVSLGFGASVGAVAALASWGGGLTAWAISALLVALVDGAALRQGVARLTGMPRGGLLGRALGTARRSLCLGVLSIPLRALGALVLILWLGVPALAYGAALEGRTLGVAASLALALALLLLGPLRLFFTLWPRVAFARSIDRDAPAAPSLFCAAGDLSRRGAAYSLVQLLGWLFELVGTAAATGALTTLGSPGEAPAVVMGWVLASQLVAGLFATFLAAFFEQSRLQAFVALDLDAIGMLPRPELAPEGGGSDASTLLH